MIRRGGPGDVDAIAECFERSLATLTFLPRLHTLAEHQVFLGRLVDQHEAWVWVQDGVILGFIILGDAMVEHLYIEPAMTGRGIGRALLDHAKRRRPAGFSLWTFQQNDRARRFYERQGMRVIRLTDGEANEEKTPDVLYRWRMEGDELR